MRRRLLVTILMLSLVSSFVPTVAARADAAPRAQRALEHVANTTGLPREQLSIATTTEAHFPLSGTHLAEFKVMATDGQSWVVSFDSSTDEIVDAEAIAEREQTARLETYGGIDPALYARMHAQAEAGALISVAIWVRANRVLPKRVESKLASEIDAEADRVRASQDAVVDAARALGATARRAELVPVLFADLTVEQINALAGRADIAAIQQVPLDLQLHGDDAGTTDRFKFIWPVANGAGATVAVHELDGVDDTNTFLKDPVYWCSAVSTGPGGTSCTLGKNIDQHATNVAGMLTSTHAWRRGGAWGIRQGDLLSANFQTFTAENIVNSASWAIASGADIINMSWGGCSDGGQTFFSRWVDYLVRTFGVTIVTSAGNRQCSVSGPDPDFVSSPSLGWNTISVGSFWDNDTGLRTDDEFSSFSSWKNPVDPNSGRSYEKPDVAGMGGQSDPSFGCRGVETTGVGGGAGDVTCGTSFAAPDVAALAALIVGENASLGRKAEAVKAIVMAGATHNVADGGGYTRCPTSPTPNDCRDGAGGIDAYQTIQNVVVPGAWRHLSGITRASFDAAQNIEQVVTIPAGRAVRAVIAWDSTAACTQLGSGAQDCTRDGLNADLDLLLIAPNGTVVARSASLQNSAEVIDYTATIAGNYTIRVHWSRFNVGTSTDLGIAWNLDKRDLNTPLTKAITMAPGTTRVNQTTDRGASFWDAYTGNGCDGLLLSMTGLEKIYRVTTTTVGDITAAISNVVDYPGVNSSLTVTILRKSGPANLQNSQVVGCSFFGDVVTATAQPPGTYLVVVDGFNGSVARFDLSVTVN